MNKGACPRSWLRRSFGASRLERFRTDSKGHRHSYQPSGSAYRRAACRAPQHHLNIAGPKVPGGLTSGLTHRHIEPDTWVTLPELLRREAMPWKERSVMDKRLQLVARGIAGEPKAEEFGISRKTGYQIFRWLPAIWHCGVHRPKPPSASLCQPTTFSARELHSERQA